MANKRKNSSHKTASPYKQAVKKNSKMIVEGIKTVKATDATNVIKASGVVVEVKKVNPRPAIRQGVRVPQFSPIELLDEYAKSSDFRKCVDSGKYVFANGYMVLRSLKCIEILDGKIAVKNSIRDNLEDFCVHHILTMKGRQGVMPKQRPGVAYRLKSRKFTTKIKNAKKFSDISADDWTLLIATGGGDNLPYDFGVALTQLMEERAVTIEQLAEVSWLSEKTISRLRSGANNPTLPTVIAICIGLSLDPFIGEQLVNLAGYSLGGKKADRAYKLLLGVAYSITMSDANEFLEKMDLPILTKSRE